MHLFCMHVRGNANASVMHACATSTYFSSRMVNESTTQLEGHDSNNDGEISNPPASSPSDQDSLDVAVVQATNGTVLESAPAI